MGFKSLILSLFLVLPVLVTEVAEAENLTSCDKAKQPKLLGSCCNIPRNDRSIKFCRQSLLSQTNQSTNNGKILNLKSDKVALHVCMAECVFKKNGFLQANGTVNLVAMQKNFEQRFRKYPSLVQIAVKSLRSCADYAKTRTQQFQWMHIRDSCDYYPATLLACIMEQIYQNCPVSLWKNTNDCVAMKNFLIDCDDIKGSKK